MNRIPPVSLADAKDKTKEALEKIKAKAGRVPNIFKIMATSPAAVDMYFGMNNALAGTTLSAQTRERIALVVGEENKCEYCVSAHSAIAKQAGLTDDEVLAARGAKVTDPKENAIVGFAKKMVAARGFVTDQDVAEARKAGVTDEQIIEIIAAVSFNIFTNYFNHVTDPVIDFPKQELLKS